MLPELHAERQLAAIEAAAVPHMSRVGSDVVAKYQQMIGRDQKPRRATLDDLRAIGFAVATVPKKKKRSAST